MSTAFENAWNRTGVAEGGYVNNPNDSGGATNHGITEAVARAHGFTGDMKDLTVDEATAIAKVQYWDILMLDDVAALSESVADEMFDTGFMSGQGTAGMMFQKALNLFNRSNRTPPDYAEVTEDGHVGKMTVYAFAQYMKIRGTQGELVMLRCLNAQQGSLLMEIGRDHVKDEDFEFGWFLNRVAI